MPLTGVSAVPIELYGILGCPQQCPRFILAFFIFRLFN